MRNIVAAIWDALRDVGAMLSIVCLCIGTAVVYGVCHDQITARVCIEYFSVFHSTDVLPPGMNPRNPTQQGFFWGVFATWWMGLLIGVPLSIVARVGTARPLAARDLIRPVAVLLGVMATFALPCRGHRLLSVTGRLRDRNIIPRSRATNATDPMARVYGVLPRAQHLLYSRRRGRASAHSTHRLCTLPQAPISVSFVRVAFDAPSRRGNLTLHRCYLRCCCAIRFRVAPCCFP